MGWLGRLFARGATALPDEIASNLQRLDRVLQKAAAGGEVGDDELETVEAGWQRYTEFVLGRHKVEMFAELGAADRADFFLSALKLTALGHPSHSAWPFLSGVRTMVLDELKRRVRADDVQWTRVVAILPA